jgi:hypothetical protein
MLRNSALALGVAVLVAAPAAARADDEPQVALAAEVGAAGGGGTTPGGLRLGGRYLYRLSDNDWFDGGLGFTFGGPDTACGRTPPDGMECNHGVADGFAGDLALGVRRHFRGQAGFTPFLRGGVFGRVLRFAADDISGAAVGLEAGAGVAAELPGKHDVAIVAGASAFAGRGWLGGGVGGTGQLGMLVSVGAELRLP